MYCTLGSRIAIKATRRVCRAQPLFTPHITARAASTKHPKGFVPPTQEDLVELRERVQEFTSK